MDYYHDEKMQELFELLKQPKTLDEDRKSTRLNSSH